MRKNLIKKLMLCSLFAALSAVLSQISLNIGPVPINLTHISIFTAAGLLGAKYGAISQAIYVLMGAVGIPVFTGFAGGIERILGPTGGFIIGYIACSFITGFIIGHYGKSMIVLIISMYFGWIATYLFGVSWFMFVTKTGFTAALTVCFFPFLIGDIFKTILSAVLVKRLSLITYSSD